MDLGSNLVLAKPIDPAVDYEEIDETDYSAAIRSRMQKRFTGQAEGTCLLDILDTAGQEEYSCMRESYTRTGQAFLIVYSITDRSSFEEAHTIYEFLQRTRGDDIPIILCGNKLDLSYNRQVSESEGLSWANTKNILFIETSARTSQNIEKAFVDLVRITPRTSIEYKLVILGAGGVGKSAMTTQFTLGCFVETYDPTIEDSYRKHMIISGLPPLQTSSSISKVVRRSASLTASSSSSRRSSGFFGSLFGAKKAKAQPDTPLPPSYGEATQVTSGLVSPEKDTSSPKTDRAPVKKNIRRLPKKDANVLLMSLGSLAPENFDKLEVKQLDAAPPACTRCSAILFSQQMCQFCGTHNSAADEKRLVRRAVEEYIVVKPALTHAQQPQVDSRIVGDRGLVVFVVDVSGSMGVTQKANAMQATWQQLSSSSGAQMISRLDCMKDAMTVHLDRLEKYFPNRKVAIFAFASDVEIFVSGNSTTQSLSVNEFDSEYACMKAASQIRQPADLDDSAIKKGDNAAALRKRTAKLQTRGATALGGALALALGLAKLHKADETAEGAGTEIFLCTDGAANTGIGCADREYSASETMHGRAFYTRIGELAVDASAKINIIGITGEGVGLDVIGVAAQISGGTVTTVQMDELRREIRLAAQKRVVAKDVEVKLRLSKEWHFDEDPRPGFTLRTSQNRADTLIYKTTQVEDETSISISFGINNLADGNRAADKNGGMTAIQAEIKYTNAQTGEVRVRYLNKLLPVTQSRESAESGVEVALIGTHILQRTAFDANRVLVSNLRTRDAQEKAIRPLRDGLFAAHQLFIRAARTTVQQEELSAFASQSAELDRQLGAMITGNVMFGSARDEATRLFSQQSSMARTSLWSGVKKSAVVNRRGQLI